MCNMNKKENHKTSSTTNRRRHYMPLKKNEERKKHENHFVLKLYTTKFITFKNSFKTAKFTIHGKRFRVKNVLKQIKFCIFNE